MNEAEQSELKALIKQVESRKRAEAAAAVAALKNHPSAADMLIGEIYKRRGGAWSFQLVLGWQLLLVAIVFLCLFPCLIPPLLLVTLPVFGLIFVLFVFTRIMRIFQSRNTYRLICALASLEDKKAVGVLLDELHSPGSKTRKQAIEALTRLLPQMTKEELLSLPKGRRDLLEQAFYFGYADGSPEFCLALIHAFEHIGTGSVLPNIRRLSEGYGLARNTPDLQEAAKRALPIIQARLAEEKSAKTLLRAAPRLDENELLLRPVDNIQDNEQNLMRNLGEEE